MKFKVVTKENAVPNPKHMETVNLRLDGPDSCGDCRIRAVDEHGQIISTLVRFDVNGKLYLSSGINEALGFKLTSDHAIVTEVV